MRFALVLAASACGRVSFDPIARDGGSSDGGGDGASGTAGIYYADDGDVFRRDVVTGTRTTVITSLGIPNGLAFDAPRNTLYISDDADDTIVAAVADTFEPQDVYAAPSRVEGLVVDGSGTTIYYAAKQDAELIAVGSDGQSPRTVTGGISGIDGVAYDPVADTIYFSSAGGGFIARVEPDGTGFQMISAGLTDPEGLTLDGEGHIYFVDATAVRRVDLDGSDQVELVAGLDGGEGIALDLPRGQMYWTESGSNELHRANLDGTADTQLEQLSVAEDIVIGP